MNKGFRTKPSVKDSKHCFLVCNLFIYTHRECLNWLSIVVLWLPTFCSDWKQISFVETGGLSSRSIRRFCKERSISGLKDIRRISGRNDHVQYCAGEVEIENLYYMLQNWSVNKRDWLNYEIKRGCMTNFSWLFLIKQLTHLCLLDIRWL